MDTAPDVGPATKRFHGPTVESGVDAAGVCAIAEWLYRSPVESGVDAAGVCAIAERFHGTSVGSAIDAAAGVGPPAEWLHRSAVGLVAGFARAGDSARSENSE